MKCDGSCKIPGGFEIPFNIPTTPRVFMLTTIIFLLGLEIIHFFKSKV
jgi:hypothetical protein